jgi:hypothetical protein
LEMIKPNIILENIINAHLFTNAIFSALLKT